MRHVFLCFFILLCTGLTRAGTPLDGVAVVVDNDIITQSEVQARMNDVINHLQQDNTPMPPMAELHHQVLNQLILESIQLQMARRAGVKIDDDTLNSAMSNLAAQSNLSLDAFKDQLNHTPGTSYDEVRQQVRNEIMINRLRGHELSQRIRITDQDVAAFLASPAGKQALATEYHLAHILIALPEHPTEQQVADARAKANSIYQQLKNGASFDQISAAQSQADNALQGGDLGWRTQAQIPTLFATAVPTMKVGDVLAPVQTDSGFHIIRLLEKKSATGHIVHQWACSHILIKPSEILSDEAAHQKIELIYNRLLHGGNFAQLAALYSEDPGSARNGGSLGWVSAGEMVPAFDAMMQKTPVGTISAPFHSRFGWHILEVTKTRDQDMSKEYQEDIARRALFQQQYDDELQRWLREIRAQAYVDIKHDS